MRLDLQEKLFKEYPDIFVERTLPMQQTCMCWGIECPSEWYDIIDTLCLALSHTYTSSIELLPQDAEKFKGREGINTYGDDEVVKILAGKSYFTVKCPQVIATQVKEKYGGLRFYYRLQLDNTTLELLRTGRYPELDKRISEYGRYLDGVIHYADYAVAMLAKRNESLRQSSG